MRNRLFHIAAIFIVSCRLSNTQFTDEIQVYEEECLGENRFVCLDRSCIYLDQRCDGIWHCADGSDEIYCPSNDPAFAPCNKTHVFHCHDHSRCLIREQVCNDKRECNDGSDERYCKKQVIEIITNNTCLGLTCDNGTKCIADTWVCDGIVDCKDKSDEYNVTLCKSLSSYKRYIGLDGRNCESMGFFDKRFYACKDKSYCISARKMCNGMQDCRDNSDEGPFCKNWATMCNSLNCTSPSKCREEIEGPVCECSYLTKYSNETGTCENIDECLDGRPVCSHKCVDGQGRFTCACEEGYSFDRFGYLCSASEPEPILFYSTSSDIRYYQLRNRNTITVVKGVKQVHGISYDGTYLYWVETAQGHQAIVRAKLDDAQNTKQTLIAIGLEDPGDIAIDWITGHFYFTDVERGHIAACNLNGSICTVINTSARHPKFVTLHPQVSQMYWADWLNKPVIMRANMDGTEATIFWDDLLGNPTGLAIDIPNDRLYYVDRFIYGVRLDGTSNFLVLDDDSGHPYSLAVFENFIYWSDWMSNSLQVCDKIHAATKKRRFITTVDTPVFGIHVYHPLMQRKMKNPCHENNCSDVCLLGKNGTYTCACVEGRKLIDNYTCGPASERDLPQFLIVAGGNLLTKIRYNCLSNPESRATSFDVGRVQAMAYNNNKHILYLYDGQRKTINYVNMNNFSTGLTKMLEFRGLENIVDMDYDYISNALYFVDAGRKFLEVISLKTKSRAIIYRFPDHEIPISLCVMSDYGRMMIAVTNHEENNHIYIDTIGLDGDKRHPVLKTGFKGPRITLRYSAFLDNVYVSDEGNGDIHYFHPTGTGKEIYRRLSTTITSLAVSDTTVFWTDRRTPRLFWAEILETEQRIRRLEMTIFPNSTQLHLQTTSPPPDLNAPLIQHPCFRETPCSHVCVQISHPTQFQASKLEYYMGYKCLCPVGLRANGNKCESIPECGDKLYCHEKNICMEGKRCDGHKDCPDNEDESNCEETPKSKNKCSKDEQMCDGVCIKNTDTCKNKEKNTTFKNSTISTCDMNEFQCKNDTSLCIQRWQECDGINDCPDASDEIACDTFMCLDTEFMCVSGSCVLKSWRCDGEPDCPDGTDELSCENKMCSPGYYQCRDGECIEILKRCDAQQDCADQSDEDDCHEEYIPELEYEEPMCNENEYTCATNRSICLPFSARCNTRVDCPDGSDESDCGLLCKNTRGFLCVNEHFCIRRNKVCDGIKDCVDGSDEAPWHCAVNQTTTPQTGLKPNEDCHDGFLCANGQCLEWSEVCDSVVDCDDRSDESTLCPTSCDNHTCDYVCQKTPLGGLCVCPTGFKMDYTINRCMDIDECAQGLCSQKCHNIPGSFLCSCFHGYVLRSNRRTCKATKGTMTVLYVSDNSVRAISADGHVTPVYNDPKIAAITDMDYDVRRNILYVTSSSTNQLIQFNGTSDSLLISNIGKPTKISVEWITGNVYFVDITRRDQQFRVCDVQKKKCAKLQKLPHDTEVTALTVDPANSRMFYCLTHDHESIIWSSSLSGHSAKDLATVHNCTGLAVDSFKKILYVAETGPSHITVMDYDGEIKENIIHPNLQSPHRLWLFEDHIYYLVANSFKLSRCTLYDMRRCEPYIYRIFDANTFVLKHESVQRDDVVNTCLGYNCSSVCVLGENGPQCVCEDGTLSKAGQVCLVPEYKQLPLFNGWSLSDINSSKSVTVILLSVFLTILVVIAIAFVVYQYLFKKRRDGVNPLSVRFRNVSSSKEGSLDDEATVELPTGSSSGTEFVNPVQYMRNVWRQSFKRTPRPVGTAGLRVEVPPPKSEDDSDSEVDNRDTEGFLNK